MESIFLLIAVVAFLWVLFRELGKHGQRKEKEESHDEESLDEFFDSIFREQEEINKRWEEQMIEINRIKHRFEKLKSPKPKWIQQ